MAKGNMLLGFARKKVGDLVMYRANGEQITRARNRNPRNPKSDRQAIQRCVLATAAKTVAALRPLYNHSWQGVETGARSLQHAQKKLMTLYRAAAVGTINADAEALPAVFALKGAPIGAFVKGQPLTTGSLTINSYKMFTSGGANRNIAHYALASQPGNITDDASYRAALATMGLEPGDQLTVVVYSQSASTIVAEFGRASNVADAYRYARITFVPTLPEGFSGSLITNDAFSPELIERTEGIFPAVNTTTEGGDPVIAFEVGNLVPLEMQCVAVAIARSQKQSNGKTAYSNSSFVEYEGFVGDNIWQVFPSYQDGAEEVELGDEMYLKNAVAAPFA